MSRGCGGSTGQLNPVGASSRSRSDEPREHGRHLGIDLADVVPEGRGMALQVEDQDLSLPDRLALELLVDGDAGRQLGLGAVGSADGLLERRKRYVVHRLG